MSSIAPGQPPSPLPYPPSQPVRVLRSPQGIANAAIVLLSVAGVFALLSAWGKFSKRQNMNEVLAAPPGTDPGSALAAGDIINNLIGLAQSLILLATAVVFIVWFHRVRCNAEVFRPDGFSQSAGWAIGGWFVPIANLFFPYRTARETWDASTQSAPDGSFRSVSGAPVVTWWLACVAAWFLDGLATYKDGKAIGAAAIRDASSFGVIADLVILVAAVLAVLFVRKLTALQGIKAAQGPNAAA
ncbi:DUF4328 domain-containing protein [Streptomyces sp. NPDC056401]|uniref:DUF4328 domain-containing protein n=1 Tax=Streptomyces sp. NPDC056401 TaxID=3345809 RepID=UPI0035DF5E24